MKILKFFLFSTILIPVNYIFAQEIITKDGVKMGPKEGFMGVCQNNMNANIVDIANFPYSVYDFCNCMSDELLPELTREEIRYFFAEGHMTEMFENKHYFEIIRDCVTDNMKIKTYTNPPPTEKIMQSDYDKSLVDTIVVLCDYQQKFYSILDASLETAALENKWNNAKVAKIRSKFHFEDIQSWKFHSGYSIYSTADLKEILQYLKSLSSEEIKNSPNKYENIIIHNIQNTIDVLIIERQSD